MGCLKFLRVFMFYFRTVEFYLGRGVTWVVGFNSCGLLVALSLPYFVNFASYLCSGGTWVHVVIEINLLMLNCVLRDLLCIYLCFSGTWVHVVVETGLPVFWLYLGTCCD